MKSSSVIIYVSAIAAVMVSSPYVFGWLSQNTLNTSGVMADANLGIYTDSQCTQASNSINWGVCYTDTNVTRTLYIKNEGNVACTLVVAVDNWTPETASDDFLLSASCDGITLAPNAVAAATFILDPLASASQLDSFGFDIVIHSQE
jgi:archaellum component FlaG (FlaF/FlaG flagellin family)